MGFLFLFSPAITCADAASKDEYMEKVNIGNRIALYPSLVTVVGAEVNGKVNWLLVSHTGLIAHNRIMVSMSQKHYTNRGIIASRKLSINLVDRNMLPKADYVGSVSGSEVDKIKSFCNSIWAGTDRPL